MRSGPKGSGVEARVNDIRVRFHYNGERYCLPFDLPPTKANIAAKKKLMVRVRHAIEEGTFTFEEFFPDHVQQHEVGTDTFGHFGDKWLKSRRLAAATHSQYALALAKWKERTVRGQKLGDMSMARILHSDLAELVGGIEWPSAQMRNNSLIPLRGAFAMWVADDRRNRFDPMEGIENAKFQKGRPDPMTEEDADRVVARLYDKYPEEVGAYYEFAFWSWTRPEEEIAILWTKVNESDRTVRIDVARTFRGGVKDVKTYEEREIECNDRAWAAIMRMKKHTKLSAHGHVFQNPVTRKPWHDERSQRDHYWKPTLKYLGIRERRAYCTRHTGITLALRRGCDPSWVAEQAGHKNTKMLWEVYSKWIKGADRGSERAKMNTLKEAA
jgi:integrase